MVNGATKRTVLQRIQAEMGRAKKKKTMAYEIASNLPEGARAEEILRRTTRVQDRIAGLEKAMKVARADLEVAVIEDFEDVLKEWTAKEVNAAISKSAI